MKIVLALIILLETIQTHPNTSQRSGWREIVPLRSTRSEVEKLLRPSSETRPGAILYRTKDETVLVFYSDGTPCGTKGTQWRVARDTVVRIEVTPARGIPLSEYNLDEAKYKKKSGGHRPEDVYYINEEKGEVLRVFNGEVLNLHYGPTNRDKDLQCPPLKRH